MSNSNLLPRLYLAGKIRKNCWRHSVVPNLRGHPWSGGPILTDRFTYMGPFFTSCDHGCYHGHTTHGARSGNDNGIANIPRQELYARCIAAVERSDLVFAYINAPDCYGTIVETQHAIVFKKYVVIAFAPEIASEKKNDFWMLAHGASEVIFGVPPERVKRLVRHYAEKAHAKVSVCEAH